MSADGMDTVRRIGAVLDRARAVAAGTDPDPAGFFAEKADLFDAIAAADPHLADTAAELAERARHRAADLRGEGDRS